MPVYKIDVYIDEIFFKTVYAEAEELYEAEDAALENLCVSLDVEEVE